MDTPQLNADHVADIERWPDDVDAWFGPAEDGGFWALALREPRGDLVRGVPMSRPETGARQRERLEAAGLRVGTLPTLTDIDDAESLRTVTELLRNGRLTALLRELA
jgi:glycosyltransferase A (GT-A) superfamily protein (DUF2064 family)